jgi:hypothetical protein
MANTDYNVYNTFDIHYDNYGELYKTPRDMNMNSSDLIGDYADALMKGPSDVYINSPELLGNRYFLDTQTQCLDKNDNTQVHNRSVLVDNINASAMSKTKNGNKGLFYSLLASMKSIDSDKMFDMSNGEPIKNATPTAYLNHVDQKDLPVCTEVSVYADDKKQRNITGWVTSDDRDDIDPLAISEGFASAPPMVVSGSQTGEDFMAGAQKQQTVLDENVKATQSSISEQAASAQSAATDAVQKSQQQAASHGQSAAQQTTSATQSNMSEQKNRSEAARAAGIEAQLKAATLQYLQQNPPNGVNGVQIYDLIIMLLNTTYSCGSDDSTQRRIPYQCVQALWDAQPIPDTPSVDAARNDLCNSKSNQNNSSKTTSTDTLLSAPGEQISPGVDMNQILDNVISPGIFFNNLIDLIKTNQNNTTPINSIPGFPPQQICVKLMPKTSILGGLFGGPSFPIPTMINGSDYVIMTNLLNTYRFDIAKLIVRYNTISAYGHCKVIQDQNNNSNTNSEGFASNIVKCPKQRIEFQWMDVCAWIYMFVLFVVFFYIFVRFVLKSFSFDKFIKSW